MRFNGTMSPEDRADIDAHDDRIVNIESDWDHVVKYDLERDWYYEVREGARILLADEGYPNAPAAEMAMWRASRERAEWLLDDL